MFDLEEGQERTLRFLCEASTQYAILAPAVSRSLGRRLRTLARSAKVTLHPSTEQLFCPKCSQVYVPGCNCHVSTRLKRRKRRRKKAQAPWAPNAQTIAGAPTKRQSQTDKTERPKRFVQYSCGVCSHRRRTALPRRPKRAWQKSTASGAEAAPSSLGTVAQKKQAAASEEARNAARVAKRLKAKAKATAKAKAEARPGPEGAKDPKALAQPQPQVAALASELDKATQPEASRRKRPREDQLTRVMKQLERAGSSTGFDF
ncbi:unnamed protein product [Durusdinium trenchii]|uniref:Uncharacterized protein n=2 Tax=Durusdinium trenchii TaxID=1381693 RepID=A0ABP0SHZ4_9DINO